MGNSRSASRRLALLGLTLCVGLGLSLFPATGRADLDPRDYVGVPPGTFLMITYFRHIAADQLTADGNRVSNDANLTANVEIFRPVYYTSVGGYLCNIQALIITGDQEVNTPGGVTQGSGFFDPVLLGTFWFINNAQSKTWLGFSPYFSLPIGSYNNDKGPINPGKNRWAFKEELMLAQGLGNGWFLDVGGSVEFYTKNDEFGPGKVDQKQDPLWTAELHLSKDITKVWYVGGSYYYHFGGETEVAGVKQKDQQRNHSLVGTLAFGIADNYNVQLQYRNDFLVESGFKTDAFQARFLYVF